MCSKIHVLDAFCGVGGASRGYQMSGAHVTGIDIEHQPNYCGDVFIQGDAIEYIKTHGHEYEFIHASPVCKAYSSLTKGTNKGRVHVKQIPATRDALDETGRPYVIENVAGAPIYQDLMLCGEMFGLKVIRHRFFEFNGVEVEEPTHIPHKGRVAGWRHGVYYDGPYFAVYGDGGGKGTVEQWQAAMGIDWTFIRSELNQAIPPAYATYIGNAVWPQLV